MVSKFVLSIVFWCVISLSVLTNGETECKRISNCPAYSWLENPEMDSGFSSRDIIRQLNRIHCGWESQNRLIHCPSGNVVEGTNMKYDIYNFLHFIFFINVCGILLMGFIYSCHQFL